MVQSQQMMTELYLKQIIDLLFLENTIEFRSWINLNDLRPVSKEYLVLILDMLFAEKFSFLMRLDHLHGAFYRIHIALE